VSGTSKLKPGLEEALAYLRSGDTLVVWKLDRLGQTVKGLVNMVQALQEKGIQFRSITDGIDTSTSAGRFFFHVMAALAQMERELVHERTMAGLKAARARGRLGGRKPKMDDSRRKSAKHLLDSGIGPKEVAANLGVSRATLYRSLSVEKSVDTA
jgi:DNA invertase Pin-like site-specific DNA recombinase